MKLIALKRELHIVPESPIEEAWLEDVLGGTADDFETIVERCNVANMHSLAYLVVRKGEEK